MRLTIALIRIVGRFMQVNKISGFVRTHILFSLLCEYRFGSSAEEEESTVERRSGRQVRVCQMGGAENGAGVVQNHESSSQLAP